MKSLSVSIISALLHPRYGGPSEVVKLHAKGLASKAVVHVYGVSNEDDYKEIKSNIASLKVFEPSYPFRWFYCRGLYNELIRHSHKTDIFHAHMLWDYPVYAAWKSAKYHKRPLIITPHGSLNNSWRQKGFIKTAYRKLLLDQLLNDTSCVHVLNNEEAYACREYGVRCPIRVIPNGIPLSSFYLSNDSFLALQKWPDLVGRRVLLYLGRLWYGKGLDILPDAWAKVIRMVRKNNWLLVIAGPDYKDYREILESQINSLGIADSVLLTGPVYDELKSSLISASTLYILPSHGEGFSMALLEALAAKRPALFTDKCNSAELAYCGGGWEVPDTIDALTEALQDLLDKDDAYLESAGLVGWQFAKDRYTLEIVTNQLLDMYETVIN